MHIIKRDGRKESVKLEKISKRIDSISKDLHHIEVMEIAQKVIAGLYDGVSSRELDQLAIQTAAALATKHPDYDTLAARLSVSCLHKDTPSSFWECVQKLYLNTDIHGNKKPLLSEKFYSVVKKHHKVIDSQIIHKNDFRYDYFGFKTLERAYLLKSDNKIIERPQYMLMRVSLGIHGDNLDDAFKTYEALSTQLFTHATPTLFNSGTVKPQLSSCFLIHTKEDSIEGIFSTLKDVAKISQSAGGIGIHIHNIRAHGSPIYGTGGESNGIVPMLKVFESTAKYVDQCFVGTSQVETDKGLVPIKNIKVNDAIKTSNGHFNTVKRVLSWNVYDDIFEIETQNKEKVECTSEHIFLVIKGAKELSDDVIRMKLDKKLLHMEWVEARNIGSHDVIVSV